MVHNYYKYWHSIHCVVEKSSKYHKLMLQCHVNEKFCQKINFKWPMFYGTSDLFFKGSLNTVYNFRNCMLSIQKLCKLSSVKTYCNKKAPF